MLYWKKPNVLPFLCLFTFITLSFSTLLFAQHNQLQVRFLSYRPASEEVEVRAYVNDVQHGMDNEDKPTAEPDPRRMPPLPLEVTVTFEVNVSGGRLAAEFAPGPGWRAEVGGDVYSAFREETRHIWRDDQNRQQLFMDLRLPGARLTNAGLFARMEHTHAPFRLAGTLRGDYVRTADTASGFLLEHTTGSLSGTELNLGAALAGSAALAEHRSLSRGLGFVVRTADATERYSDRIPASKAQMSAEFMGTPCLRPKRSTQADVWLEGAFARLVVSFSTFARHMSNFITLESYPSACLSALRPSTGTRTARRYSSEEKGSSALPLPTP